MRTGLALVVLAAWLGKEPIRYCVAPEMEPFRPQATAAFWIWAAASGLPASETKDCLAPRTITYRLGRLNGVWGVALYPPSPSIPEPWAGDVWLDSSIPATRPSLIQSILVHETGHAFGMPDSVAPNSIMYPHVDESRSYPTTVEYRAMFCLYRGECR